MSSEIFRFVNLRGTLRDPSGESNTPPVVLTSGDPTTLQSDLAKMRASGGDRRALAAAVGAAEPEPAEAERVGGEVEREGQEHGPASTRRRAGGKRFDAGAEPTSLPRASGAGRRAA